MLFSKFTKKNELGTVSSRDYFSRDNFEHVRHAGNLMFNILKSKDAINKLYLNSTSLYHQLKKLPHPPIFPKTIF